MPYDQTKPWGPDNPHPLSTRKTELIWEGKYDEYGNRRQVSLPSFSLEMQRIETIDAPRDQSIAQGTLFDEGTAHRDYFRNRLIWGDNKLVMSTLLQEFRGKIDLIYIDPPFDVGADFTMDVSLGDGLKVLKEQSVMEAVAYRDTWGKGTDSYLNMIYERLTLINDLLSDEGSVFVHCDWRVVHYLKLILDDIMGVGSLRNEIIWQHQVIGTPRTNPSRYAKAHETLLWYTKKAQGFILNYRDPNVRVPWSEHTRKSMKQDEDGNWYYERRRTGTNNPWAFDARFLRTYVDDPDLGKTASDVWDDMLSYQPMPADITGYNTQKPDELIKRVVAASSREDSVVADFFCGSGTTLAVAEKLGRRWIGCDLGRYAIHTSRKRLIGIQRELHEKKQPYRSFDVYNLGRYERQWWQMERLRGADEEHRATVLKFFKAVPLESSPSPLMHGTKGGAYIHVDSIDSVLSFPELSEVARVAKSIGARAIVCLAWEFEMELRKRAIALESELGLEIRLKYIPREIMEPNRNEIQFFDAGALEAEAFLHPHPQTKKQAVDIRLKDFLPSLAEVPEKELEELRERAVRSPFDFIDFWAVDFQYGPKKAFEHHWQDYRTRKDRSLFTESNCCFVYPDGGRKQICVKVIDVFGVDTTAVVEVNV